MKKSHLTLAFCLTLTIATFCAEPFPKFIEHPKSPEDEAENFFWHLQKGYTRSLKNPEENLPDFYEYIKQSVWYAQGTEVKEPHYKLFRSFFGPYPDPMRMDHIELRLRIWIQEQEEFFTTPNSINFLRDIQNALNRKRDIRECLATRKRGGV